MVLRRQRQVSMIQGRSTTAPRPTCRPGACWSLADAPGFEAREATTHIFVTASLDAARRHAEFSAGEGRGRIYRVEPTGTFEEQPHLSDEGLSGNHARSYRTRKPIRVLDEVRGWQTQCPGARGFDPSFDFKTDQPARTRQDPDRVSPKLRSLHQVLWTKRLNSGVLFAPTVPPNRGDGYLIFTDAIRGEALLRQRRHHQLLHQMGASEGSGRRHRRAEWGAAGPLPQPAVHHRQCDDLARQNRRTGPP